MILADLLKKLVEMEGGNLREDAPETFENRFDLHAELILVLGRKASTTKVCIFRIQGKYKSFDSKL